MKHYLILVISTFAIMNVCDLSAFYKGTSLRPRQIYIQNKTHRDLDLGFYTNTGGHPALLTAVPKYLIPADNTNLVKIVLDGPRESATSFMAKIFGNVPDKLGIASVVGNTTEDILPYALGFIDDEKTYIISYDPLTPSKLRIS